jgi:hypothetical protein
VELTHLRIDLYERVQLLVKGNPAEKFVAAGLAGMKLVIPAELGLDKNKILKRLDRRIF